MKLYAIYTRINSAHAWKFERIADKESALLQRDVNQGFHVETLILPAVYGTMPNFLDSYQTQEDFKDVQS